MIFFLYDFEIIRLWCYIGLCIKFCCLKLKLDMKWRLEKVEVNKLLFIVCVWIEILGFYYYYYIFLFFKNGFFYIVVDNM